jgi:hypothetical protein
MSQQVEVYRALNFHYLGSSSVAASITCGASGLTFNIGTSGSPLAYTAGTPALAYYFTNAGTSGSTSAEPFYLKSTLTGAGQVGGRARFHLYTNVALGGWSNALKAYVEYGASGRTTGLGSAFCAEMDLSAGTSSGTYCLFEGELNVASGASLGTATSLFYLSINGASAATFDTGGFLFNIQGATSAAGKFLLTAGDEPTWNENTVYLKCKAGTTTFYLIGCTDQQVD